MHSEKMDRWSAMRVCALGMQMALLSLSTMVAGQSDVQIIFYERNDCSGSGNIYIGFDQEICLREGVYRGSIQVIGAGNCGRTRVFKNRNCTGTPTADFAGDMCYTMDNLAGTANSAYWYGSCSTPPKPVKPVCKRKPPVPSGVVFIPKTYNGSWILNGWENARLYSKLKNLSNAEKVDWLRSHGATFKPKTAGKTRML
ncbi:hypothetical protein AXG93_3593s1020 [Marchantia polymorpha subsp. ruderalis]|uniref:SUEL-type lectin domain-containing protein n=1 Tax=Marchantia polymorpha subsp. ruderalis TaxID=1480154 RepID=A0A176WUQ6_MARPO|nr:hypothetical protein AXG93_3593s1020 [Marchantia polymorpha subsp. ruderalis]